MPIIYDESKEKITVTFTYDPLVELFASLHVLSDDSHHREWWKWSAELHDSMEPALLAQIIDIAQRYNSYLFLMDISTTIAIRKHRERLDKSYENSMKILKDMDDVAFSKVFLGFSALHLDEEILRQWVTTKRIGTSDKDQEIISCLDQFVDRGNIEAYLSDIPGTRAVIRHIVQQYWNGCFSRVWKEVSANIEKNITVQRYFYKKEGLERYITDTFPQVKMDDKYISIDREVRYYLEIEETKEIFIFPSAFTAPHIMLDIEENDFILYLNVPYQGRLLNAEVPQTVKTLGKILSDGCRVKILRLLAERESTTSELSEMMNLAKSTVSAHLKMLKSAGVVTCRQEKKFVYYVADEKMLRKIIDDLKEYII